MSVTKFQPSAMTSLWKNIDKCLFENLLWTDGHTILPSLLKQGYKNTKNWRTQHENLPTKSYFKTRCFKYFFLQNNITCNFLCRSLIYVLYFRRLEICPVLFASLSIVWFYVERRGSHVWRVGVTVVAKWKARTVFYF